MIDGAPGPDERVERAAQGDADALEELLREFGPPLGARLSIDARWRRLLEPEDVLQVTYMEAFLRAGALRTRTTAGFAAWLERMARNNLNDALRELTRAKRPDGHGRVTRGAGGDSAQTLLAGLEGSEPTAGGLASGREQVERLHAALARLPGSYARVVRELDLEERPVAELAAEWGRSPGALHMLRSRAHDRLRELLGARAEFPQIQREPDAGSSPMQGPPPGTRP